LKQQVSYYLIKGNTGYILEVDLEYPSHLHDKHIGLPLAPVHRDGKLVPSFENRINYKIHLITLRLYLRHGMKLIKVHKILEFSQKDCIFNLTF
jgi:hypothetical protein